MSRRRRRSLFGSLEVEGLTRELLGAVWRRDGEVRTEQGLEGFRTHVREVDQDDRYRHAILYRCVGCGTLCCMCNGSDSDPRCDECTVRDPIASQAS